MHLLIGKNISTKFRHFRRSRLRTRSGSFLVEALFATLIASMVAAMLVQGYARVKRAGVSSQTQLQATGIASEIYDQLRAQSFTFVLNNQGTHNATVVVDATHPAPGIPDKLFPRPLLRDADPANANSLTFYKASDADDSQNILHVDNNTVQVTIAPSGASATALVVTVNIGWTDGAGHHTYNSSSILAQLGLNG